eukprot:TRINITY_DN19480_c0_g1_i1.p1 TRINITY_DN19480_c0_g1~~TRINITY_DN19480_c0_g1_i1.p1  ORF type:complete len:1014 (-),score=130.35 TRINITY_DN19480_c0_g1_i1:188-3229(-)
MVLQFLAGGSYGIGSGRWTWRCTWFGKCWLPFATSFMTLVGVASATTSDGTGGGDFAPPLERIPLDLDPFEDEDCIEVSGSEILLTLMHEMCEVLDQVLYSLEDQRDAAWAVFDAWAVEHETGMSDLAHGVLTRSYCEPAKLSFTAARCLLHLRSNIVTGTYEDVTGCAEALDEDFLQQMTQIEKSYQTRLHLVLRSPWPAFRLLDLLVRLYPDASSSRMGACKLFQNWNSDPDVFDWPWFKPSLTAAIDVAVRSTVSQLRPEDGPLSRQYRARWLRIFAAPGMKHLINFADDVVNAYKTFHYRAGCHLGVISAYALSIQLIHTRDTAGQVHRLASSVAQLINLHAPFVHTMKTDWPLFRLLHFLHLQQRSPPRLAWASATASSPEAAALDLTTKQREEQEPRAPARAAAVLCKRVEMAVIGQKAATSSDIYSNSWGAGIVYVSAAWGALARFTGDVVKRWSALFGGVSDDHLASTPLLLLLTVDGEAARNCATATAAVKLPMTVRCVEAFRRKGIEAFVAKYLALASITRLGKIAVWLDLDVFVLRDPSADIVSMFDDPSRPDLIFSRHLLSESAMPAVIAARGSSTATDSLLRYAGWLKENAYLLDHQGWDAFLSNWHGDFAGAIDYKGRNVTVENDTGPKLSFVPDFGAAPSSGVGYSFLSDVAFGSGDGWLGVKDTGPALFHFWGVEESQADAFKIFYSSSGPGVPKEAQSLMQRYWREPSSGPRLSALLGNNHKHRRNTSRSDQGGVRGSDTELSGQGNGRGNRGAAIVAGGGGRPLFLVALSYADGCCTKSLQKNRQQALLVGVDEARAYGRSDLDPTWAKRHDGILSQRPGAGWWLWKPHLILRALRDPAVPWHRGVVIWTDAGNFLHADPRPFTEAALQQSDVSALRLKLCIEEEWSNIASLQRLGVAGRYAITESPQMGAYFLLFRKTQTAINFVEDWLRHSEDPEALIGKESESSLNTSDEMPLFRKHQADQSVLSVLFKLRGFKSMSLQDGHKVVTLARWRE